MSTAELQDYIAVFDAQGDLAAAEGRHADAANWHSTADHFRQQLHQQQGAEP